MSASSASSAAAAAGPEPLVGIGLPVYNGERYLRQALDGLLGQSLQDVEIVISDNGSTDSTAAICAAYAAAERRIRYTRQPQNIGLPRNWNFVARQARGRYFKWASANDLVSGDLLERCVELLESRQQAVLAFGRTRLIDAEGLALRDYADDVLPQQPRASERYRTLCENLRLNNAISGVIRRRALMRTGLVRPYPASDVVLMAELALQGSFEQALAACFFRRVDAGSMSSTLPPLELMRLHDPASRGGEWVVTRRHRDLIAAPLRIPGIAASERARAAAIGLRHALWSRSQMLAELGGSVRQLFAPKRLDRAG